MNGVHLKFRTVAFFSLLLFAAPAPAQTYDDAAAAYRAGNLDTAVSQLRLLANDGHARAQYDLGLVYEYGRGVGRDDAEAVKWYRKAATQEIAVAQYRLAVLQENGWGTEENDTEAVKWYRAAAVQGHALAQHDLAFMYMAGTGVQQSHVHAYMWLRIAVAQGNGFITKHLHHVRKKMTDVEVLEAEKLAQAWLSAVQR